MLAVFNFDAVAVPIVERMLAEGRLPTLAALRERGQRHELFAPALYFGDRMTAHSGVEVSEHGLYFPLQWSAAAQRLEQIRRLPAPELLWERLGRGGVRTLVVDPYEGRRPASMAGVALSGVQFTHSVVLQRWSYPPGAERPVIRKLGRAKEVGDAYGHLTERGLRRLRDHLLAAPARAVRAVRYYLARDRFDLVWTEFGSTHLAGHHFLPKADDTPAKLELKEGVVEEVYAAVDAAIGEILNALPGDVDVLVFSETGMDVNSSRSDLLPELLSRVLGTSSNGNGEAGKAIWRVRAAIPPSVRLRVTQLLPDNVALELWAALHLRGVDWSRTRAFALPSDHDGYVRLNVRGREAHGIVSPDEMDDLAEEIAAGLKTFRDESGTPWIARIDRASDLYEGSAVEHFPDLLICWSSVAIGRYDRAHSPEFGEIVHDGAGLGRAGNHVEGAWVLAVPGTSQLGEPSRPARLVDLAATACTLLGADLTGLAGEALLTPG